MITHRKKKTLEDYYLEEEPEPRAKTFADYEKVWNEVVKPDLHKRALWRTWRTYPCQKIAKVLPPSFRTWSDYLEQGGVIDKSTGLGSLTRAQKRVFWSDQCACKCWGALPIVKEEEATLTKIVRDDRVSYLETIDGARSALEAKKEEERMIMSRVDSFWKELELAYADVGKKGSGEEMIAWYWNFPLKVEFLQIYNQRFKKGHLS